MDPMNFRDNQIIQAQNNPNILSPLSGAPPVQTNQLAQRAATQPNPQAAYAEAGKVGQEMAQSLYGTGTLKGMAGNWDQAIQELARYDVMKEQQLVPQQAFTPGYVSNPVDQANFIGAMGSNVSGGISRTGSAVQSVEQGYQNAIANVIDKFINFYEIAEMRRQKEEETKRLKEQQDLETMITLAKLTGGEVTFGGKTYKVPGPEPTQRNTSVVEVGGRKKLIDTQTGQVIQDLGEAEVTSNLFGTQGTTTAPSPTKKYYPPPMSAPAGTIQSYGGIKWKSLGNSQWQPVSSTTAPALNLESSGTAGSSATLKGEVWR